ncbi:FkbM family methyltransferase [Pseudodesulfovibrio sediminis]|nr:FkbM family methyltransferase [Pseudodesulfovibrio sediminis]
MGSLLETRFTETECHALLQGAHLGFVDVGAAGGFPQEIHAMAGLTDVMFFEPDPLEFKNITALGEKAGFARMIGFQSILADSYGPKVLNVTKSGVNSSLLTPNKRFCDRYNLPGFEIIDSINMEAATLDGCLEKAEGFTPDIIKIDCQGVDYSILKASDEALSQSVCVFCEMIVAGMYDGQNGWFDINALLESKGFRMYGMWPHYISNRKLDRKTHETNERLLFVDGLYFKDPLVETGPQYKPSERSLSALFVAACLYHYYDFAIELAQMFSGPQVAVLRECVVELAAGRKQWMIDEAQTFVQQFQQDAGNDYLLTKKFIDRLKDNNDVAFIADDRSRNGI